MGSAAGLFPAFSTRSSARVMVSFTAEERVAAMAEERAEKLHQFEITRFKRKVD
jgi:hypothetical protein